MGAWDRLFGNIASNAELEKKYDKWPGGISGEDLPAVLVFFILGLHTYISNTVLFIIPISKELATFIALGFGFLAYGFAKLNFGPRFHLWSSFKLSPDEMNLFSKEFEYFMPIVNIKDNMIFTSGTFAKGPAVVAGIKVIVLDSFDELSRDVQQMRMRALRNLTNALNHQNNFLQYIKTKPLDLTAYTDFLEKKASMMDNNKGLKYYTYFFAKDLKNYQKRIKVHNQEIFMFFEVSAKYVPSEVRLMKFLKGENVETFKTEESRIKELRSLIEVYVTLISNLGFKVDELNNNDLRDFFMSHTSANQDYKFERGISIPNNFMVEAKK